MVRSLADLQGTLNANRLFQQQWEARQKAGGIIAAAPDWQSASKALQADPQVSGFLPEITTAALNNANINQSIAGQRQTQGQSALEGVYHGLALAAAKPELFDQAYKTAVGAIPPDIASYLKANGDPVGSIGKILGPLAKSDPEGFQRTLAAAQLMTVSPGQVFAASGRVAPSLQDATTPLGVRGGFGEGSTLGGGAPAVPVGGSPAPGGPAPGSSPPAPAAPQASFIGSPLAPDPKDFITSSRDAGGRPIREPQEQAQISDSGTSFLHDTHTLYPAAANSIASLDAAKDELGTLARASGPGINWLASGAAGNFRLGIANTINTVAGVIHPDQPSPIDMAKVAAGQALQKNTRNLAFSLSNSMMGQHGGLGVLEDAYQAVPGIENSPLGGMLVADTLKASSQWLLDQQAYKQQWANANHGDLRNADQTFLAKFPPAKYIGKVMDQYGLGPKGFTSPEAVKSAYDSKLITRDMAAEILKSKFGGQ